MKCRTENIRRDAASCYFLKSGVQYSFWKASQHYKQPASHSPLQHYKQPASHCPLNTTSSLLPINRLLLCTTFIRNVISVEIITRESAICRIVHNSSKRDPAFVESCFTNTSSVTIRSSQHYYYHHHHRYLLYAGFLYIYSRDKPCP